MSSAFKAPAPGSVEINGTLANGRRTVTEVRLRFNGHDRASPVSISLHDIVYRAGAIHLENEMVARVNLLVFRQKSGTPKMEISLASVKPAAAGDGLWQMCIGKLRGRGGKFFHPAADRAARRPSGHDGFRPGPRLEKPVLHISICHQAERHAGHRSVTAGLLLLAAKQSWFFISNLTSKFRRCDFFYLVISMPHQKHCRFFTFSVGDGLPRPRRQRYFPH